MPHARRSFLRQLAVAGAALAVFRPNLLRAAETARNATGYSKFAPLVGNQFTAVPENGDRTSLKLVEVSRLKSLKGYADEARAREQCFTLVLRGDEKKPLAEGIYRIEAAGLVSFEAFMSPILGDGKSYQIVFNNA